MRSILMLVFMCCAACATARDDAATITNTAQSVLASVDDAWTPIVQDQIAKNRELDDAAYKSAMSPYLVVQEAIEQTRRATQLLNLAVQTWDAQADGGAMWREFIPCVEQDIALSRALLKPHQKLVPEPVVRALQALQGALHAFNPDGACRSKRAAAEPVGPLPPPLATIADDAGAAP